MIEVYKRWFDENRTSILEDFFTFLRFPTISTDPEKRDEMAACKDWLLTYFEKIGMKGEVWECRGHPTLFATHMEAGSGAPTLLFYCHYDVQPAEPLDKWDSAPFEPEVRDGSVYARGASDNKGQGFYTITAVRAFLEIAKQRKVNIKVLIEGEEEIGSPGLEEIAEERRRELQADHLFIVDLDMYDEKTPAVTLGTRGVAMINVTVRNARVDLHSGFFGGVVVNPARALSTALGKIWDERGQVTLPNFYEGVKQFTEDELELLDWNIDMRERLSPFDVKAFQGEGEFSLLESNLIRPTVEINGMESGYTGKGSKTIIPAVAMVKLSCRLVEGQDPEKILDSIDSFLIKNLPEGIEVEIERGDGTRGMITSPHSKSVDVAVEAYERVFREPCRRVLSGATIPIAPTLSRISGGELVMIGVGLATDGIHSPNECFGLDRFEKGFLSITQILEIFSSGG
ncbi:MAG: Succinyl-diaminopimelate desuccinylase [Chlamydiae bacterium]|nr:Succinyl-diaminopimelate desuccinylase [Chlamydiota bacterium]